MKLAIFWLIVRSLDYITTNFLAMQAGSFESIEANPVTIFMYNKIGLIWIAGFSFATAMVLYLVDFYFKMYRQIINLAWLLVIANFLVVIQNVVLYFLQL